MGTDSIDQELNSRDRGVIEAADRVWQRIAGEQGHFEDWNVVREALMVGRQYAMRALHIQEPRGKAYNDLFGRWRNRHFPNMSPVTCSNLLFLADPEKRMIVDELRRAMSEAERMQVTHPDTMAKRVRRHLNDQSSPARPKRRSRSWNNSRLRMPILNGGWTKSEMVPCSTLTTTASKTSQP